ncbi:DUF4832 domain-containing protein [Paenibacillus sp. CF384]|uniref:DUF4832 domain-containing protein n=1 Tax=Paenibacillus sp. CF384 TaxID=1884382 RepID=UPI00089D231B|nr:DUF4832 domain-containing protein [Paenibacillus sp. CF384]SDW85045.1 Carbohydrate binding module (family 6) [Paenibacillus sp. CF384]
MRKTLAITTVLLSASLALSGCKMDNGDSDQINIHSQEVTPKETTKSRMIPTKLSEPKVKLFGLNTFKLTETSEAFNNPIMGFRPSRNINDLSFPNREYADIYKHYIKYTDLEVNADSVQKIKDWSTKAWAGIEKKNIKVVPRVIIVYPGAGEFWPTGVVHGDPATQWLSDSLKARLVAFIGKLGQAWDNDPRVAFVELGLYGNWGEHHIYPNKFPDGTHIIPPSFQKALGDAYTAAFRNKKMLVRYTDTFTAYNFGIYWDSFALPDDAVTGNGEISRNNWRTQINSGEVAYNWGNQSNLGGSPNGTLSSVSNTNNVIDWIMKTHTSSLGWISDYTATNPAVEVGATAMQKVLGYRFVLNQATFTSNVAPGGTMNVSFQVTNKGSSPFYYNWPVEANLLKSDGTVAWKGVFQGDIRTWLPGSDWNSVTRAYNQAPTVNTVNGAFKIPTTLANGTYTLTLSILDPAGWQPGARFANTNYYTGGRTPIGKVGIGMEAANQTLGSFASLKSDKTLGYSLQSSAYNGSVGSTDTQAPTAPAKLTSTGKTASSNNISWTASTDNVGVTGYEIYRNGSYAGTTTSTSFSDTGLKAATNYSYMVRAKDAAGNVSSNSNVISVATNAVSTSIAIEAESAANTLAGGAIVVSCSSCAGGSKVGYVGNNSGTLQFNRINVATAGTYTLILSYVNGDTTARAARIHVNGTILNLSFPSTGSWSTLGTLQSTVQLKAGDNTIKFSNASTWAPDFDRIQIRSRG